MIITINLAGGGSFGWDVPDAMWLDLQAFSEASGLTIEQIINLALENYFEADRREQLETRGGE